MNKEYYMQEALKEAKKACCKMEVPVGAVVVLDGKIIGRGHNRKEKRKCALDHAEIIAIKKASKRIKNWRLNNCELYVTLEPCPMCTGAIISSRIKKVYIGANDFRMGACGSKIDLLSIKLDTKIEKEEGILKEQCEEILMQFFKKLREKNKA